MVTAGIITKILGAVGVVLTCAATIVSSIANDRKLDEVVDKKLDEREQKRLGKPADTENEEEES